MLADPTLSGTLRRTKIKENLNIEKAIQDLQLEVREMRDEFHAIYETLTSDQVHQEQVVIDPLEPPYDEMMFNPPTPQAEPLPVDPNIGLEEPPNPQEPIYNPPPDDPVQDVEMSDANEVDISLPVITGPEEVPLTTEQEKEAEIKRLQEEINKIEAQLGDAKENSGRLEAANSTLTKENSMLTGHTVTLTEQILKLTGEIVTLTGQNLTSMGQVTTFSEQNAGLQRTNADLSGENASLSSKLESMRSELTRFRNYVTSSFTNFCNPPDNDRSRSSSVRDSGVGLYPTNINTPLSPPPSSP